MKRGQIYFVAGPNRLGAEDVKFSRPAIIVTADALISNHDTVEVVYLTTHPWSDQPTHVTIRATGVPSVALCELVSCLDKAKLGDLCGECTPAEMQALDAALMLSLGITPEPVQDSFTLAKALIHAEGQRDAYKALLEGVLAR